MMDLELFFNALEELANVLFPMEISRLDALVEIIVANIDDIVPKATTTTHRRINSKSKVGMEEKKR